MILRRARPAAVVVALALVAGSPAAHATNVSPRTVLVSTGLDGAAPNGASASPAVSITGRYVAYATTATNVTATPDANGPLRDVVVVDRITDARRLVSAGGDGDSFEPAIAADGGRVAYTSRSTNLVAGDTNAVNDIFIGDPGQLPVRVSVATDGTQANGASSQPDISADGRYVVFTSAASNLVPGDDNGQPDVFVRDTVANQTNLVSSGRKGASSTPAISADGHWISFFSAAPATAGATDAGGDVYVANRATGALQRVSVTTAGVRQNASIAPPFTQVSDLSSDGRFVAFDSDATNLAAGDTNDDTDVFLRDRLRHKTTQVSVTSSQVEGDNDSFFPTITPNGRFVVFESFAENLGGGSAPREDAFVRDLKLQATSLLTVGQDNQPRGPELVPQLLQRPALSNTGHRGVFTSTAAGLVPGDVNGAADVFMRRLDAPNGSFTTPPPKVTRRRRPPVTLGADDPGATRFQCQVDSAPPFDCPVGTSRLPRLRPGRHVLSVRAGGPGMLYDASPAVAHFTITP